MNALGLLTYEDGGRDSADLHEPGGGGVGSPVLFEEVDRENRRRRVQHGIERAHDRPEKRREHNSRQPCGQELAHEDRISLVGVRDLIGVQFGRHDAREDDDERNQELETRCEEDPLLRLRE